MSGPDLLLFSYPAGILLSLVLWLLLPRKAKVLLLLPALFPLSAFIFFQFHNPGNNPEISLPFLHASRDNALEIRFQLDALRTGLAMLVAFLSFLIQWYSLYYLKKEDSQGFFHFLIALFQIGRAHV